jgi:hypothetical protein
MRRRSIHERRKDYMRRSLYLRRLSSNGKRRYRSGGRSCHHVRVKTREVSVHVKGPRGHRRENRVDLGELIIDKKSESKLLLKLVQEFPC